MSPSVEVARAVLSGRARSRCPPSRRSSRRRRVYVPSNLPSGEIAYTVGSPPESLWTQRSGGCTRLATTPDTSLSTGSWSVGAGSDDAVEARADRARLHLASAWRSRSRSRRRRRPEQARSTCSLRVGSAAGRDRHHRTRPRTAPDVQVGTLRLSTPTRSRAGWPRAARIALRWLRPRRRPAARRRVVGRVARALTHREARGRRCGPRCARRRPCPRRGTVAPMFSPELMPETTRSGRVFTPPPSAQITVSAGMPFTAIARVAAHRRRLRRGGDRRGVGVGTVARPALVLGRRDDGDLDVRQLAQRLDQHVDARALHAVVVRDQHPQRRRCPSPRRDGGATSQRDASERPPTTQP